MYAVTGSGCDEVVELLVDLGANIDSRDRGGMTALNWAASNGDAQLVALLLRRGAKPNVGAGDKRSSAVGALRSDRFFLPGPGGEMQRCLTFDAQSAFLGIHI